MRKENAYMGSVIIECNEYLFDRCIIIVSSNVPSNDIYLCTHRIVGAFKVQEHFADEHAPTFSRVTILHLR